MKMKNILIGAWLFWAGWSLAEAKIVNASLAICWVYVIILKRDVERMSKIIEKDREKKQTQN
jgi:hypothetical protein